MLDFSTTDLLIKFLKEYGICNIVASPGMQNAKFNVTVQNDSFFRCYSVVDERSAAYVATGMCFELKKPVCITCTGATSSRNYLPGMTEAFYRDLPVVAITFFNPNSSPLNLAPQFVDRSVHQKDVRVESVNLPVLDSERDLLNCSALLNNALSTAVYKKLPVHINCPADFKFSELSPEIPPLWHTKIIRSAPSSEDIRFLLSKNIAIFIGSHSSFSKEETDAISQFAKKLKIPVICDHTSCYVGENKVLTSLFVKNISWKERPSLVIDLGGITGDYSANRLFANAEIWRLAEDGKFKNRANCKLTRLYTCDLLTFFQIKIEDKVQRDYFNFVSQTLKKDTANVVDLPLCTALLARELSQNIPRGSSLHLAILNSLRCMDFFTLDNSVTVNSNVGGFGIDGPLSSLVGQSLVKSEGMVFGLVGDLAFFYDMNILGNRSITNNVRILLVNNNKGEEFRLNAQLEKNLGEQTNQLIAAAGHYKNGAKAWAESCGFRYMSARDVKSFTEQIRDFCTGEYPQPLLFEVFTKDEDEQRGLQIIQTNNLNPVTQTTAQTKSVLSKITSKLFK